MMKQIAGAVCGAALGAFLAVGAVALIVQALLWWYGQ